MTVAHAPLADVATIVTVLEGDGIVALPTDTVYGVAASVNCPRAIARLFTLKDRPVTTPLPVLVADRSDLDALGVTLDERATRVMATFWPGALTIVVAAPPALATMVGASAHAVGFRQPDDDAVRRLLRETGPLCVTSANVHGASPCHDPAEVELAFLGRDELDLIVDGGRRSGPVSTVIDLSAPVARVVRDGAISADRLTAVLGDS